MLDKEVQLDFSHKGNHTNSEFLIDSDKGFLSFYLYVFTPVEIPKSPEVTYTGKLAGKTTKTVDIYTKYSVKNFYKYKDWEDVEILLEIFDKNGDMPIIVEKCHPYSFKLRFPPENINFKYPSSNFDNERKCAVHKLKNGKYKAKITVINSHSDFNRKTSTINIQHISNGSYNDFLGGVLDSLLRIH
jgi:hypothetical protein